MKRRNSMRYAGYDYRAPGAYAVTICAYKGRLIFGEIVGSEMQLSPLGEIAERCIENLAGNHAGIHVEATVVMPNHVHVLLIFKQDPPPAQPGPAIRRFGRPAAGSLSTLMGAYKAEVTRQARSAVFVIKYSRTAAPIDRPERLQRDECPAGYYDVTVYTCPSSGIGHACNAMNALRGTMACDGCGPPSSCHVRLI